MADILAVQENVNKLQKVYDEKYQVTWGCAVPVYVL